MATSDAIARIAAIATRPPRVSGASAARVPPNPCSASPGTCPHFSPTVTDPTGTAARMSGEYIASTRDAGSWNRPAPFSRIV